MYYNSDNQLVLPRNPRCYYNCSTSMTDPTEIEIKLRDLGYLISKGFDLEKSVYKYQWEFEPQNTTFISRTFICYIIYMRHQTDKHFTKLILQKLSDKELINLFIDELSIRYSTQEHKVILNGWKNYELIEEAGDDSKLFFQLVQTSEMTKKYLHIK